MTLETALTGSLLVSALWSILCRVSHMDPARTKTVVFLQHALLGLGLFGGLILPPEQATLSVVLGITLFLLLSSRRWVKGAPSGTDRPEPPAVAAPTPLKDWYHKLISGGRK